MARLRPHLAVFAHGKSQKIDELCAEFEAIFPEAKESGTRKVVKEIMRYEKPDGMRRMAWFVVSEKIDDFGLDAD